MGCGIGFGALHRLPRPLTQGQPAKEGQTLFENPRASMDAGEGFMTGAQLSAASGAGPGTVTETGLQAGQSTVGQNKPKKKTRMTSADIEALMHEGEEHAGEIKATDLAKDSAVPPPPTAKKAAKGPEEKADDTNEKSPDKGKVADKKESAAA
jgi:hypothetical protein